MKVLVTGFEPNDDGLNASELVVQSLRDNPPPDLKLYLDNIYFKILPGDTYELGQVVNDEVKRLHPDICIALGQARGYNKIALERMAKNLRKFSTPDRAGNTPRGELILKNAPVAYWHSLEDLESLVSLLKDHHIPAGIVNDCGTHLCNQAFYHFLHWRETHHPSMKVGFVHIPALPEQVIKHWPEAPFMPLEMTCQAVSLIIAAQVQAIAPYRP